MTQRNNVYFEVLRTRVRRVPKKQQSWHNAKTNFFNIYPLHLSFGIHNYILLITKSRHHHMKDETNFQKQVIPECDA